MLAFVRRFAHIRTKPITYRLPASSALYLKMKLFLFVAALLITPVTSIASNAHRALAEEFLLLIDMEHTYTETPSNLPEIPGDTNGEVMSKVAQDMYSVVGWKTLKPKAVEIVIELYTASELLQINTMLKSPTGVLFRSKLRVLDDKLYEYYTPLLLEKMNK